MSTCARAFPRFVKRLAGKQSRWRTATAVAAAADAAVNLIFRTIVSEIRYRHDRAIDHGHYKMILPLIQLGVILPVSRHCTVRRCPRIFSYRSLWLYGNTLFDTLAVFPETNRGSRIRGYAACKSNDCAVHCTLRHVSHCCFTLLRNLLAKIFNATSTPRPYISINFSQHNSRIEIYIRVLFASL